MQKNNSCHFTFTREILTQKIYFLQEYLEIIPFEKVVEKKKFAYSILT